MPLQNTRYDSIGQDILLVDDDPIVQRLYQEGLRQRGFEVQVAGDGMAALKAARDHAPSLIILDLMMPRLNGAEMLNFLRQQPELKSIPVVVLSNSYMHELSSEVAKHGVERALLKVSCSPSALAGVIREILDGRPADESPPLLAAVVAPASPHPASAKGQPANSATHRLPIMDSATRSSANELLLKQGETQEEADAAVVRRGPQEELLAGVPAHREALIQLLKQFVEAQSPAERAMRLDNLYRKVHFLTAMAGLADLPAIGQMSSALEALLFGIMNRPEVYGLSVMSTLGAGVEFLLQLLDRAQNADLRISGREQVLVLDDDRLTNRLVIAALKQAQLEAISTEQPLVALDWASRRHFDLILLDIEMPVMDGFAVCERLREIPGYQATPVIYVTSHSDFEARRKGVLSGGNDLIAKPVLPSELAVKSVMHLLKSHLAGALQPAAAGVKATIPARAIAAARQCPSPD